MSNDQQSRPFVPRTIRRLALPILLFWIGLAAITNIAVPQLEDVGKTHNVALNSPDAPSLKAIKRIGEKFHEFDTDSSAMIVLEGDKPLGADAHKFYDALIHKLGQDTKHVQHIQDFWGDTLTAAGSQSSDGKAAYVQLFLAGSQGEALSNESVDAVRATVDHMQPPPGVKAYLTGAAPLIADQFTEGSKGSNKVTALTVAVIAVMLFVVYRSFATTLLVLATVLVEMAAARGFVAFLGNAGILGLSTYATNLLTLLVSRVLIAGGRAVGIEVTERGKRRTIAARGEVVLSAGAYNTPQLLQLSGIGDAEHLGGLGIDVVVDNPEVGAHLKEHPFSFTNFELNDGWKGLFGVEKNPMHLVKWLVSGKGVLASNVAEARAATRSPAAMAGPSPAASAPKIATPAAPPICRQAFRAPDAAPAW